MNLRMTALAAALIACAASARANTANVDIYGVVNVGVLPAYATYSGAADIGAGLFANDPTYTPLIDATNAPGATAQISAPSYAAAASTTLGSNHAYASASTLPSNVLGAGSFSGWYDQVTITGGSGVGTASFTVQLNGTADVGAFGGGMAYALGTSTVHPSQLVSSTTTFNMSSPYAWPMDAVNPIATYVIGASPYNDTSVLFPGIAPVPDLVLTPGTGQNIQATLHGTFNFTYGETFYLLGGLGTSVFDVSILQAFCPLDTGSCVPSPDGTGPTTLDFSNSAHLAGIVLPQGASLSSASGAAYNVTAVPEPGAWLMLLAGLGLVGWRTRRRA